MITNSPFARTCHLFGAPLPTAVIPGLTRAGDLCLFLSSSFCHPGLDPGSSIAKGNLCKKEMANRVRHDRCK